jgi:hypothetical protein
MFIAHETHEFYYGDRADWRDIPVASAPPDQWAKPIIEGGEHTGWISDVPLEAYRSAIDGHVEAVARAAGYNNAATLASYVKSTVEAWAGEAGLFIPWRDDVWLYTFDVLAAVQGGGEPPETPAALVAALPEAPWPLS